MSTTSVPPPQQSPASQPKPKSGKRRRIAWGGGAFILLVLAGIAIYAAVHQGVKTINFKQGTISFQTVHPASIKNSQPLIKSELSQARARAQQQPAPAQSVPDIAGYWDSSSGLTYYIEQYGNNAVVQEQSAYGITAVGEGVVYDTRANFDFRTFNGSVGQAVFYFEASDTIDAYFENYTYGTSSQAVLTRQ
jgi:hypothetical protein